MTASPRIRRRRPPPMSDSFVMICPVKMRWILTCVAAGFLLAVTPASARGCVRHRAGCAAGLRIGGHVVQPCRRSGPRGCPQVPREYRRQHDARTDRRAAQGRKPEHGNGRIDSVTPVAARRASGVSVSGLGPPHRWVRDRESVGWKSDSIARRSTCCTQAFRLTPSVAAATVTLRWRSDSILRRNCPENGLSGSSPRSSQTSRYPSTA